jgi:hypothetical protein
MICPALVGSGRTEEIKITRIFCMEEGTYSVLWRVTSNWWREGVAADCGLLMADSGGRKAPVAL